MKVLFLPSEWPHNEERVTGIFVRRQAKALQRAGVTCDVVFAEPRRLRRFHPLKFTDSHFQTEITVDDGIPAWRLRGWNPLISTAWGGRTYAYLLRRLVLRYLEENDRPDVIHAHNAIWGGIVAAQVKEAFGIPVIITEHSSLIMSGLVSPERRRQASEAYRKVDRLIAVSRAMGAALEEYSERCDIRVVPNVVDTSFFSLARRPTGRFVFVAVANLNKNKALDLLLRAFARAFTSDDSVSLVIGGDGPERHHLQRLAQELGLQPRVRFLGRLTPMQVRDSMWNAHAFVLCSYRETFGVVLIEAMATGLPVISTRSGGPDGIVTDDVGLMVNAGDEAALAEAMKRIRTMRFDPFVVRHYAEEHFGEKAFTVALKHEYEAVLQ